MAISEQERKQLLKVKADLVWQRRWRWVLLPIAFAWMTLSSFAEWPRFDVPGWTLLTALWAWIWCPRVQSFVLDVLERHVSIETRCTHVGRG